MTGALILGVTFGIQVDSMDDPYIILVEETMSSLTAVGNVGSYMGMLLLPSPTSIMY